MVISSQIVIMQNKVLFKKALKGLQGRKKSTLLMVVTIALSVILSISLLTYQTMLNSIEQQNNKDIYGAYHYIIPQVNDEEIRKLQINPYMKKLGFIKEYGSINEKTKLISIDDTAKELLPLKLLSGHLPEKENEIALEQNVVYNLGLEETLGQTININNQPMTLVGILNNYSMYLSEGLAGAIVYPSLEVKDTAAIFMTTDKILDLLNVQFNGRVCYNSQVYGNDDVNTNLIIMIIYVISAATFFILMTIMSYVSREQAQELLLLRGIGASKKQAARVLVYEGTILGIIGITLGIILGVIVSNIVSFLYLSYIQVPYHFSLDFISILFVIALVSFTIMLSIQKPIYQAKNESLTGEFKSHYRMLNIKKSEHVTEKMLAKRYLASHNNAKISSVFLITITVLLISSLIPKYYQHRAFADFEYENKYHMEVESFRSRVEDDYVNIEDVLKINGIKNAYEFYYTADKFKIDGKEIPMEDSSWLDVVKWNHNNQELLDILKSYVDEDIYNQWLKGEGVIVFESPESKASNSGMIIGNTIVVGMDETVIKEEDTYQGLIEKGDIVKFQTNKIDVLTNLKALDVVQSLDFYSQFRKYYSLRSGRYLAIMSPNYEMTDFEGQLIAIELTEKDVGKNVENRLIALDNVDTSDVKNGLDQHELLEKYEDQACKKILIYIALGIVIGTLVIYQMTASQVYKSKKELGTLKSIGMSHKQIYKMYLRIALKTAFISLWLSAVLKMLPILGDWLMIVNNPNNTIGALEAFMLVLEIKSWIYPVGLILIIFIMMVAFYLVPLYFVLKSNVMESLMYKE